MFDGPPLIRRFAQFSAHKRVELSAKGIIELIEKIVKGLKQFLCITIETGRMECD